MTGSLHDALVVARFQLTRALRTRSALLICILYALVAGGSAYGFTRILLVLEQQTARVLRVPETDTPGAMLDAVKQDVDFQSMLSEMLGDPALLDWALTLPFLTITSFWTGPGVLPFIAAAVGAEGVAPDVRDRALRFELVRTGRGEILAGRFLGLALLLGVAGLCAIAAVWIVAMTAMVNNPPLTQLTTLLMMVPRLWVWSMPFLGLGLACSQATANVNGARVLALAGTTALWIAWGFCNYYNTEQPGLWSDILLPLFPQSWAMDLWGPGLGWTVPGLVLLAQGVVLLMAGYPIFARRNL